MSRNKLHTLYNKFYFLSAANIDNAHREHDGDRVDAGLDSRKDTTSSHKISTGMLM